MIFGSTKEKIREYKLKKIRRGWHEWFAWCPVSLEGGGIAWLHEIEKKFYQKSPRSVVKKGLNESKVDAFTSLSVMYRRKGSDAEKCVYHKRNGSPYVDPNEIFRNMPDGEFERISKTFDKFES